MLVELKKDARILHKAGEIVDVSPTEYKHLTSLRVAVKAEDPKTEEVKKPVRKKKKEE